MKSISKALKLAVLASFLFAGTQTYAGSYSSLFSKKSYSKSSRKASKRSNKKCYSTGKKNGASVPIDGGLSFLLLGAAAFGVKKLRGANESNG